MTNQDRYPREGRWETPDVWRGDDSRGWEMPESPPELRDERYQGHPSRTTGYQPREARGYRDGEGRMSGRPQEAGRPWYGDGGTSEREWYGERGAGYRAQGETGPHSGRGPKGYRRNDDRICEDVCEALTQHGEIDASEIEVKVEQGEVILTGMVEDRRQKRMAEDIAERCAGVKDIRNELRISRMAGRTGEATGTATTYSGNASRTATAAGEPVPAGNGQRGNRS